MSANGSGFANQEFVEEAHGEYEAKQRDDARDALTSTGTKAWLEEELARNAISAEVYGGREFDFRPMGNAEIADIVDRAAALDDDEDVGDAPQLFRDLCALMGEHCLDDEADAEFFGMLPAADLQETFESLSSADMDAEDRERAEDFRS